MSESSPWEEKERADHLELMRKTLLDAASRPWDRKTHIRYISLRDQIRAEVREKHPDLADFLPPMDY